MKVTKIANIKELFDKKWLDYYSYYDEIYGEEHDYSEFDSVKDMIWFNLRDNNFSEKEIISLLNGRPDYNTKQKFLITYADKKF